MTDEPTEPTKLADNPFWNERLDMTQMRYFAHITAGSGDEHQPRINFRDSIQVSLAPGDMTVYHLLLVHPKGLRLLATEEHGYSPGNFIFGVLNDSFSKISSWNGRALPHEEVMFRWTENRAGTSDEHTAMVLAIFLELVADEWAKQASSPTEPDPPAEPNKEQ